MDRLIIVEGFFDVMWLHQNGFKNVVVLMGNTCSPTQVDLLINSLKKDGTILIMLDGDVTRRKCASELLIKISQHRLVSWIVLDEKKQPDKYSYDELNIKLKSI